MKFLKKSEEVLASGWVFLAVLAIIVVWLEARAFGFKQAVDVFTGGDGSYYCEPLRD